ncbi:DUF2782 domain-containing protein [Dokdonella sp.]|uniref:DUF2782 domain-containing protein n=1 Tax=Dokdonella sp. TaxID=2291710 RepID=UPI0031BE44B5|nr:DUF2782 domain-containing protein [Dokdonella sp.]
MNPTSRLLLILAIVAGLGCASVIAADPPRPARAEIPPPPGLDDPGVNAPVNPPAAATASEPAADAATDPLAPLPPPDARLVRDKASRDAAESQARVAASQVTTRTQGKDTIEEYRQNGHLWMIKIHPQRGPTQTFYADGPDGRLMRNPNEGPIAPVYYTLYEWK